MKLTHFIVVAQSVLGAVSAADSTRQLQPWKFAPLPVGSIKPRGWLLGETQAMATGLPGHAHEFYIFVSDSTWLHEPGKGGAEYSNLNEALPYWFNGLVPMAYTLDDDKLKGQVHDVAERVLGFQTEDGWVGPETGDKRNFWSRTPFFLGLIQLAEADKDWEDRIVDSLQRFMKLGNKMLHNDSQGFTKCANDVDCTWGQARVHDMIIVIQWLLEKYPSDNDAMLWDNMDMFYDQSNYKWDKWYDPASFPKIVDPGSTDKPWIHGVNVGQGLKASSVMFRFKGTDYFRQRSHDAVDLAFNYHGSASGTILADEWQRDNAQYIGSELCTAVETSYSLAYLYQSLGDNSFADRAERTIFNAFPVMMTGDKWAHQYMSSPNQPFAVRTFQADGSVPPLFTTANSGVSTTYGMEPQYPCCTVNHPQGYPKFITNSWVTIGDRGLGHALLSPSSVSTTINGGKVSIECDTNYPFATSFTYTIENDKEFDFYLRVPEWVNIGSSSLSISSSTVGLGRRATVSPKLAPQQTTGMHKIKVSAGRTTVSYSIGVGPRVEKRPFDTVSIFYGNLLYSLDVGYSKTTSLPHSYGDPKGPGLDYLPYEDLRDEYVNATTDWNVAIDPSTIRYNGISGDDSLPDPIFEHNAPPTYMTVDGCQIKWDLKLGVSPDVPPSDRTCIGSKKTYRLIPHGAAKVHMSELPTTKF